MVFCWTPNMARLWPRKSQKKKKMMPLFTCENKVLVLQIQKEKTDCPLAFANHKHQNQH